MSPISSNASSAKVPRLSFSAFLWMPALPVVRILGAPCRSRAFMTIFFRVFVLLLLLVGRALCAAVLNAPHTAASTSLMDA
eukprot:CAMPEP_0171742928 /NCGR_PEP_ID=MMETSP0991-20121206/36556_1 /TAXON_ID=483369 /ORGANISM="non described non described, Strain CCMP2098" /LENGTH=80 /DNA_ID=CAMNT_0012341701 /DNA_START=401 /DNA_END=639 /DNA_ORIENTATION=-